MLAPASEPVAALRQLLANRPLSNRAIERFLASHTFPLQEGRTATFAYRGPADEVRLRHWIQVGPKSLPFFRLDESDLWQLTVELPECARIEYKLEITTRGERRLLRDPLNPLLAHDPFGTNSVCYGPGYTTPDWTQPDPAAKPGSVRRLNVASEALGEKREVAVYLPAGWRQDRRYPILVAHDGRDYVRYSGLKTVLDNLIHRAEMCPTVVALTEPGDRLREYAGDPRHAAFLADELVPLLETTCAAVTNAKARGLMGASFGAVASLYTAWRYPLSFGRLLLQSGSFVASRTGGRRRGPEFKPVVAFTQLFRTSPRRVSERVFMSCGIFESLARHNRELAPLLEATGMEVRYSEALDGHNWENWRDRLREGLCYLFPGPKAPNPP